MGGLLYHALGVDGEQGVYQQGGAAPDQRLKKALQWKATLWGVEGDHDDQRRYRGLLHAEEQDGKEPCPAGGQRRLEDLYPCAPEKNGARAQTVAYPDVGLYPLSPRRTLVRLHL